MKAYKTVVLLLVFVPVLASARKKNNEPRLPAIFNQAKFVYVQAFDGGEYNPNLLPEDRRAILDVMNAIRKWDRYVLVYQQSQADLVFLVRTGQLVTGRANVGIIRQPFPGTPGANGNVAGAGAEVGPPDDLLWVCMLKPDGTLSAPLWSRTEKDGLESPDVPLFKEFKREVDKAYPRTAASKAKMP